MSDTENVLKRREFQFRMIHQRQDLVGEHALSPGQFDDLTRVVNGFVGDSGRRLRQLCRRFAATTATFLVHCSLYEYTARTANLWDGVWRRLTIGRSAERQRLLGETFLAYLQDANLPRLKLAKRPYVGQILLHTPIPLDSMANLFQDVVQVLAEQPELTVADLGDLAWPVATFIEYGGRLAEDVIARGIDLYRHLQRYGSGKVVWHAAGDSANDGDGNGAGDGSGRVGELAKRFGLPPLIVRQMEAWFPTRPMSDGTRRTRMQLRFDPYGHGVLLEVRRRDLGPAAAGGPDLVLQVDGEEHEVDLGETDLLGFGALGAYGPDGAGERVVIAAPKPGTRYELYSASATWRLVGRGVEVDGPTYFDPKTGRRHGSGPLPAGDVWVLTPRGWTVMGGGEGVEPGPEDELSVRVEELPDLAGPWRGYKAFGLHTQGHTFLRWFDEDGAPMDGWERAVEPHADVLPRLSGGDEFAPWLTPEREGAVYLNRAPRLWLPVHSERKQDLQRWSIRCVRAPFDEGGAAMEGLGAGEDIVFEYELADLRARLMPAKGGSELDLEAEDLLGNAFGDFIVAVHGPLGLDAHIALTLARGLDITFPEVTGRAGERERGIDLFQVSSRAAGDLVLRTRAAEVVAEDGEVGRGAVRGRRFVVSPDEDAAELLLRVSRTGDPAAGVGRVADARSEAGVRAAPNAGPAVGVGSAPHAEPTSGAGLASGAAPGFAGVVETASIPVRLRPAAWRLLDLDTAAGGSGEGERANLFAPISLHVVDVQHLVGRAIAFQTFLNEECRYEFTLLADGEPIGPRHSWRRSVHAQRSRVDLARFAETLRGHTASDIELWATVAWSGRELKYLLARIAFDWQVLELETELKEYPDGSGDMSFVATWRDVHPPRDPRKLVLEDRWRRRVAAEVDVKDSALTAAADFTREQLPPGRYTVGFVSRSGWRRSAKRPARIDPPRILDVRRDEWRDSLRDPEGVDGWLLALYASLDGAWDRVSPPPSLEGWDADQTAALGRALTHPEALQRAGDVVAAVRKLPLKERLGIAGAAVGSGSAVGSGDAVGSGTGRGSGDVGGSGDVRGSVADFRRLAVTLALPRSLNTANRGAVERRALAPWPALLALAGLEPLPRVPDGEVHHLWGYLYALQDPHRIAGRAGGDEDRFFAPERPARLLLAWWKDPARPRIWRRYGQGLEPAYQALLDDLPKLAHVLQCLNSGLGHILGALQKGLFSGFRIGAEGLRTGGESHSLTAKLAFVCAGLALLQRTAAYETGLSGWFDRKPHHEWTALTVPDLYDYYLLLAEALLRRAGTKGVA